MLIEEKPSGEFLGGIPSFRYGGNGLDQVDPFYYEERTRYRYINTPHMALMSIPHLAVVKGYLRLFQAYSIFAVTLDKFFEGRRLYGKRWLNSVGNY